MSGARVVLERVEHGEAGAIGQVQVEHDRARHEPLGERESLFRGRGAEGHEVVLSRETLNHAQEVDVVLDDEDRSRSRTDLGAIVFDGSDDHLRQLLARGELLRRRGLTDSRHDGRARRGARRA